ncbi:hypothetical protein OROGR_013971 [Orobanche gracilis]
MQLIEAGDYINSEQSISELVKFLNSISDSLIAKGHENEDSEKSQLNFSPKFVNPWCFLRDIIDAFAFELPKAVARCACVSTRCLEVAEDIVDLFVGRCSPRDILPILCEVYSLVLVGPSLKYEVLKRFTSWLKLAPFHGLMKVLVLIQRRHYKHVKTAVSVILNCLKIVCPESDEDTNYEKLFHKAVGIACSIREICEESTNDGVDSMDCFSQIMLGAALAVIWGYKASEVDIAAGADLNAVIMDLQGNWTRSWEARGMLSLQAIQMVIMYASGSALRKNAFSAFKMVIADIPTSLRLDVLRALIKNSESSSMIGILLNCVKEELHMAKLKRGLAANAVHDIEVGQFTSFWNSSVLKLVEEVIRPPEGGPPSLYEYSDVSAP